MSEQDHKSAHRQTYAESFATEIISQLKEGAAPWQKPWRAGEIRWPFNAARNTNYKGGNALRLMMAGYQDPRWMTLRQANELDLRVKKGSRSRPVAYWQWTKEETVLDDRGQPVLDAEGREKKETVELTRPWLKIYNVFHVSQLYNLETGQELPPFEPQEPAWDPLERVETIFKNSGAEIRHDQRDRSFYRRPEDVIHLPPKDNFPDAGCYYSTALHELAHWTGHPGRENREPGPFGSEAYAKEELRAEIASWMLSQELNLPFEPGRHGAYVKNWIEVLENDPYEIIRACRDAERIKEYVMGLEKNLEREQPHPGPELKLKKTNDLIEKVNLTSERGIVDGLDLAAKEQSIELIMYIAASLNQLSDEIKNEGAAILNRIRHDEAARQEAYAKQEARENEFWQNHSYLMPKAPLMDLITDAKLTILASRRTTFVVKQEGYDKQEARENEAWQDVTKKIEKYEHKYLKTAKKAFKEPTPEKTFLAVPFKEKDLAKKLGAKWSRDDKLWYAPAGTDLGPLAKWRPENTPKPVKNMSPVEEFAQALEAEGLILDGPPIMDGEMHRVRVAGGKPGSLDGAYFGHLDGCPNGMIFNHKQNTKTKFMATGQVLTEEQKAALKIEAAARLAQREKERQALEIKAVDNARAKWNKSLLPSQQFQHPYLKAKSLEELPLNNIREDGRGNLMIPLYNAEGVFRSMQTVNQDGQKQFEKGCPKTGNMHVIGDDKYGKPGGLKNMKPPQIYISEGYATGASVFLATENPVVVAFDAGNLKAVAMAVREILPEANITICADNDQSKNKNVGLEKAQEAAQAVGGEVIVPEFTKEEKDRGLTDFNDLHQSRGLGAVRRYFGQRRSLGRAAAQVKSAVSSKVRPAVSSKVKSAGMGL